MDNQNAIDNIEVQQCPKCKEQESEMQIVGIALVVVLFVGPIIGILIGLFAGKKLLSK